MQTTVKSFFTVCILCPIISVKIFRFQENLFSHVNFWAICACVELSYVCARDHSFVLHGAQFVGIVTRIQICVFPLRGFDRSWVKRRRYPLLSRGRARASRVRNRRLRFAEDAVRLGRLFAHNFAKCLSRRSAVHRLKYC